MRSRPIRPVRPNRAPRPEDALAVRLEGDTIRVGRHFTVSFQRTLRIPDDGREYPLPPGLGCFPLARARDHASSVPSSWLEGEGEAFFLPMYQREAMWISFHGSSHWHPSAVKVGVGNVDALTGEVWDDSVEARRELRATPQNYLVVPQQPWLDGINAGTETIRQFVAMQLGQGYTVEGQLTGSEDFGGLQLAVFAARPGRFPEEPPREFGMFRAMRAHVLEEAGPAAGAGEWMEMGLGAGGRMRQQIFPDPYGAQTWDPLTCRLIDVYLLNSMAYRQVTGRPAPETPVTARMYTQHGYPWFDLYEERLGDVPAADALGAVKSVREVDEQKGLGPQQDDAPMTIPEHQVIDLTHPPVRRRRARPRRPYP